MFKIILAVLLMILALICAGSTVYDFVAAKGAMSIWSAEVIGAAAFHGICMIAAMFLLADPAKLNKLGKEA